MRRIQCIMKMKLQVAFSVKMEHDQITRKIVIMHKESPGNAVVSYSSGGLGLNTLTAKEPRRKACRSIFLFLIRIIDNIAAFDRNLESSDAKGAAWRQKFLNLVSGIMHLLSCRQAASFAPAGVQPLLNIATKAWLKI